MSKSNKFDHCLLEVKKIAGRELTKQEEKSIKISLNNIVGKLDRTLSPDKLEVQAEKLIDDLFNMEARKAAIAKRQAALDLKAQVKGYEYIKRVWADAPGEGLKAILGSSLIDRAGARNGLVNKINSSRNRHESSIFSKLRKDNLEKIAADKSPEINMKLTEAIWALEREDKKAFDKMPAEIRRIAEILVEAKETARLAANKAGAYIEKLDSQVMNRAWDMDRVKTAAGDRSLPASKHKDEFIKYISARIDYQRTFSDMGTSEIKEYLADIWTQFSAGTHVKFNTDNMKSITGASNIGKRMSHNRVLHFRDAKAEFEVFNKFGVGRSVTENVVKSIRKVARDTAIMEKLGPNAEDNLEFIINAVKQDLTKANDADGLAKFEKTQKKLRDNIWPFITGQADIPGNMVVASVNAAIRNWQALTKLGGAVLSALGDVPAFAATHRYFSERNVGALFNGAQEAISATLGTIGKKITPEQMEMASEMGILLDGLTPFSADVEDMPGAISDATRRFFKLVLLSDWQDRLRLSSANATAHRYGLNAGRKFGELSEGMQAHLRQFDISEADWDFIRTNAIRKDMQGRAFLAPESIMEAPDNILPQGVVKSKETGLAANQARKYKEDIRQKISSLYYDIAATATTEPNEWIKGMVLLGSQKGTAKGEAIRHLMQFKSFTASYMRNHLGREIFGYGSKDMSVTQALWEAISLNNKSSAEGLASLIVFGTAMGYVSMSLKDIAKGRTPRIPDDAGEAAKILMASAAQSGSFGIYGDFLFGNLKSRMGTGPLTTFLGPTAGDIENILNLYGDMRDKGVEGEFADVRARAFRMLLDKTPGYNIFYSKAALDYLITYRMLEAMNPGYLRRMERRVKKENDQEFIFPPSQVVR